ncbi:MAG: COX15/CtaA family protein [Aphanocapsa lilacina HA4352-LM1]|jgi:cytochrome c oxidase assembly protein subunit 15|nr:COX15/CtaA family protein [Aphanocapsa lilacina HA4352-LM1]
MAQFRFKLSLPQRMVIQDSAPQTQLTRTRVWVQRLLYTLIGLTFGLMAVGSLTRVMGAGLSCPDWPLCYGEVLPHLDPFIFLEWFHRQVAQVVGLLTVALCTLTWWRRRVLPGWLPGLATAALVLVLVQGALGAFTVTEYLRFDIVTAHLGTAMLYFGVLLAGAALLTPNRVFARPSAALGWIAAAAALVCYGQIILGGLVASQWAFHQCLAGSALCEVMHNHLWGVLPATVATLVAAWFSWKPLKPMALVLLGLLALQIGLGVGTFLLQLSVPALTVAHLAVGAALFGSLVVLAALALAAPHRFTDRLHP